MTRLEWRYLQKIALDHPYYDTHKLPLTESEAEAIIREQVTRTGKEFVDSIYSQLGMSRPEKQKNRFTWAANVVSLFRVPPIRKIVAVALALLLLTVFFAATPTGRAVAESVMRYIATLFADGRLVVEQNGNESELVLIDNEEEPSDSNQRDDETDSIFVNSFEDFTRATGKIPFTLPLQESELYYVYDPEIDYVELHSTYTSTKGEIITYQVWDTECLTFSTLTGYSTCDEDESVYYSIDANGDIYCMKIMNDSVLNVSSKENTTLEDLIEMLKDR